MNARNRRTIAYAPQSGTINAKNRPDAVYTPLGPRDLRHTRKNPPAPERDAVRDALGALMIELDEVLKYDGV